MRISTAVISTVLLVAAATPVLAGENDWRDCTGDDPGRSIAGCTRIIRSMGQAKKPFAPAYYNRGLAYAANGEFDRAIADFNETIRLDPTDPDAFISRGGAYFATGDHNRAIVNFSEALRLD